MYCETPEENALLEKLIASNPDSDRLTLNLVAWMWINQREAYENTIRALQTDHAHPEDIPLVDVTDSIWDEAHPKEIKVIESPVLSESLAE
jgi:hypothetical protein